ncbi:MAG: calcium/sodium antiporter [Spirochaetia bacterium]
MSLALWLLVFLVSLAVLVKSSDFFITSSESIGLYFGLPAFIIGVVIVAVGTSLPELASSIVAVTEGSSEIVVGNVLGSNVTNICLVLGIAALVGKDFLVRYDLMRIDLPFMLGSAFLIFFMILDGRFSRPEALIVLAGLGIYVINSLKSRDLTAEAEKVRPRVFHWLGLFISPVFIYLGARYTVEAVIAVSEVAGIGSEVIALTAVALGTSLPELVVSVNAARRGKPEIAVGNIIGSNIFNSFAVMGIPGLIGTLSIPPNILAFAAPVSVGVGVLFLVVTMDRRVNPWIGGLLLLFYVFFIGKVFNLF